jgi:chemotaxis protein methyltransferase CheR
MSDGACAALLHWALPRLSRRWAGYRKVQRLVAKRLARRFRALGLPNFDAYRCWLESHPEEWAALDALLDIPISRFYRDRGVFESLERVVLPALACAAREDSRATLDCWSAGCASGEEPYTLAILWRMRLQPRFSGLDLRIVATDRDLELLERARKGCYDASSLKELPEELRAAAFDLRDDEWCLHAEFRALELVQQDLQDAMPAGPFDLVLCRNVVATYYAPGAQRTILAAIAGRMRPGGALVTGSHEMLPEGLEGFMPWPGACAVFRWRGPCNPQVVDGRRTNRLTAPAS